MKTNNKIERLIYIVIMLAFIVACFFKIVYIPPVNGQEAVLMNYYQAVFSDADLSIYGNIFLGIPFICAVVSICLNIAELIINKFNIALEQACVTFYICFFGFGFLFASISDNILPFGAIILSVSFAILITRIIFHYGVKKMKI